MTTLQARHLSLEEVHRLLGFEARYGGSFVDLLSLDSLDDRDRQDLLKIREDFIAYLPHSKPSEGQVKLLAIAPLLRLAGFYQAPICLQVEEGIARIELRDEDTLISGRFDIVAVRKHSQRTDLWILVIEAKEEMLEVLSGLPQLLTYAYSSLNDRGSVWGLLTNGVRYQFLYLQAGTPPTYLYLPTIDLLDETRWLSILPILKAIGQL